MTPVTVIGAGLAGCECAWQLAGRGIPVRLIEMKPKKMSFPAPASHAMRSPSPFIPGIAKLKMVFPNSYPVSSLIIAGLSPKPPVARMTDLALASISPPSLSFASTPTARPSSMMILWTGVSKRNSTPSSLALSVIFLVMVVAALGPGIPPPSGLHTCHVNSPSE